VKGFKRKIEAKAIIKQKVDSGKVDRTPIFSYFFTHMVSNPKEGTNKQTIIQPTQQPVSKQHQPNPNSNTLKQRPQW
jgi:hypothetical protein